MAEKVPVASTLGARNAAALHALHKSFHLAQVRGVSLSWGDQH